MTYLMEDVDGDLQKVRSLIVWMSCQRIRTRTYPVMTKVDTPIGYMKLIKEGRGTFAAFYAQLCR